MPLHGPLDTCRLSQTYCLSPTQPDHNIYLYSGFISPFSIFSYSVNPKSGPAFSRLLFWLQQATKYAQQLAALKQMKPKQTLYPKWKKLTASVLGKMYLLNVSGSTRTRIS